MHEIKSLAFAAAQRAEIVFLTPLKIQEDATTAGENLPPLHGKFMLTWFFFYNSVPCLLI